VVITFFFGIFCKLITLTVTSGWDGLKDFQMNPKHFV
jgi:hypothetical protein